MLWIAAAFGVLAASLPAQTAISVRSGLINHLQGQAFLDGKSVEFKPTRFLSVGKGSELRTGEGLAEVLLGPGAVLRLGENSSFRMISTDLADTRLELLTGAIIVERAGEGKEDSEAIRISNGGAAIDLVKKGVYRVDFAPARLMVYDGEAKVLRDGQTQSVKKSKMLALQGVSVAEKFDNRTGDSLFRWARRRAEYLSVANVSAARSMEQFGFASGSASGWVFNPFFGSYTYLPASGVYDSFWGYRYWGKLRSTTLSPARGITGGTIRAAVRAAARATPALHRPQPAGPASRRLPHGLLSRSSGVGAVLRRLGDPGRPPPADGNGSPQSQGPASAAGGSAID